MPSDVPFLSRCTSLRGRNPYNFHDITTSWPRHLPSIIAIIVLEFHLPNNSSGSRDDGASREVYNLYASACVERLFRRANCFRCFQNGRWRKLAKNEPSGRTDCFIETCRVALSAICSSPNVQLSGWGGALGDHFELEPIRKLRRALAALSRSANSVSGDAQGWMVRVCWLIRCTAIASRNAECYEVHSSR